MCGIAGSVSRDGGPAGRDAVARATRALAHRGPDGEELWAAPGERAILGHRRLAIIDVSGGRQPIVNEDGTVAAIVNGEIYNHLDLRRDLEARGHRFRTRSDAEAVVHLYEERGPDFVCGLRGMFALALWDDAARRLVLARDRLGKKPLVWGERDGRLVFASELGALRAGWGAGPVDPAALDAYLALGAVPAPLTIDRGWRKLEPASRLVWEPGGEPRLERYWTAHGRPRFAGRREEAVGVLRERLAEAVRLRLMSEVPLGLFLSGGVDSSAVLATLAALGAGPIDTFSIGFPEASHDETPFARIAAAAVGARHHELRLEPTSLDSLDAVLAAWGEPFADSSALPTWMLARLARPHVTVALTGDGGDELFAGYPRYRWLLRLARLGALVPRRLSRFAAARLPRSGPLRRAGRLAELLAAEPWRRAFELVAVFGTRLRRRLLVDPPHGEGFGEAHVKAAWERCAGGELDRFLLAELATYLPDDLLVKMDIATMAHGLEARSPLLDHELVELVASFPEEWKLAPGRPKALLKEAVESAFPPGFLDRPKRGFALPLKRWIREDFDGWMSAELRHGALARSGLVDNRVVSELLEQERAGAANHEHRLFALLALSLHLARRGG